MAEEKKKVWRTPPWVDSHIERYLNDPANAVMWDANGAGYDAQVQTLLLTTTGRKSGEPRHSPLIFKAFGDGYVVIASKGGWADNPAWYENLAANPNAEIRVGAKQLKVRARTVGEPERSKIWTEMAKLYPPYDDYQRRAKDREIPVVMLDPV